MSKVNNIAKNTSYLTLALILQKVISFSYFTILARNLGPENLGKYYFAISFTTIFAIFIDIGTYNVLTREVAKDQSLAQKMLGSVVALKIPLSFLSWLTVFILINAMGYETLIKQLVYISSISMILDSFSATFFAIARGYHNLKYESIGSVLFQVVCMIFGLYFLYTGRSMVIIMLSLVFASVFFFVFSLSILVFKYKIRVRPVFNLIDIKAFIFLSLPFAIFAIFQKMFMYLDSVFLSYFSGDIYVGYYQIPFKIIFALQFLPLAFVASIYPAFSLYWKSNREQLLVTFERSLNYLIIISLPISVGCIALADKIVYIFKSGYEGAVIPMQIIMVALIFMFINFPIGSLLNACDKQKTNTKNMGIVLVLSIIMNLILIPRFQAVGASITVLVTNILIFVLGAYQVNMIIPDWRTKSKNVLAVFGKSLLASFIMGVVVLYLKNTVNIFLIVALSGFLYFSFLLFTKAIRKNDIVSIYNSFIKK